MTRVAYVDPNTVQNAAAGAPLQAARLDADRDALEHLARNKPHCRVYNNAAISLPNNTITALTFNTERTDVAALHSTVSNTGRISIPSGEGGWCDFGGGLEIAANATGDRRLYARINGAIYVAADGQPAPTGGATAFLNLNTKYQLASLDFVEFAGFQNSGGAINALASGNYSPEAWLTWEAT